MTTRANTPVPTTVEPAIPRAAAQREARASECRQHGRGDACAERSPAQLVKRVGADAHGQTEGQQRAEHDARVRRGRQRSPEQNVREVPGGVRRVEQCPVIAPAAGAKAKSSQVNLKAESPAV